MNNYKIQTKHMNIEKMVLKKTSNVQLTINKGNLHDDHR